jgi:hypothetical protein
MAAKERRVPDHVLAMLEQMEANGALLHMHPCKLARSDYEDMNRVVTALGGQWKGGKTKAHVFPPGTDVAALVDTVLATGRYEDPKDADFVETPVRLASSMADRGRVRKGSDVFEPARSATSPTGTARPRTPRPPVCPQPTSCSSSRPSGTARARAPTRGRPTPTR